MSLIGTAQLTIYYRTQLRFCFEHWLLNPAWLIGSTAVSEKIVSAYKVSSTKKKRLLIEAPEVHNGTQKRPPDRKTYCFWKLSCFLLNFGHAHPFPLQIEVIVPSVCSVCGRIRFRTPRSSIINAHREFPPLLSAGLSIVFGKWLRPLQLRCGSYQL